MCLLIQEIARQLCVEHQLSFSKMVRYRVPFRLLECVFDVNVLEFLIFSWFLQASFDDNSQFMIAMLRWVYTSDWWLCLPLVQMGHAFCFSVFSFFFFSFWRLHFVEDEHCQFHSYHSFSWIFLFVISCQGVWIGSQDTHFCIGWVWLLHTGKTAILFLLAFLSLPLSLMCVYTKENPSETVSDFFLRHNYYQFPLFYAGETTITL